MQTFSRSILVAVVWACGALGLPARAQHVHSAAPGAPQAGMHEPMVFAGIPHTRDASGTAWQPDSTPMHAHHGELAAVI